MNDLSLFLKQYVSLLLFVLFFNGIILTLQGQQFKSYDKIDLLNQKGDVYAVKNSLQELFQKSTAEKDTVALVNCLIDLSSVNRSLLNYNEAFINSGEALFLAEELNAVLLKAKAHEEIGILYYLFKQDDQAGFNFKKAHSYFQKLYKLKGVSTAELYQSYYNLVLYYQRIEDQKSLIKYVDSCELLNKKFNINPLSKIYLNEKKASVLIWNNKPKEALQLLNETAEFIENDKSESVAVHTSFLIIVYARMANIYMNEKNYAVAKTYFEKSLNIKDVHGEATFYRSYTYTRYALLLNAMGDYKNAYVNSVNSAKINDTYLNPRNENTQGFLSVKNRYDERLQKKDKELATKNLELATKNQELLRFRIVLFVGLFILIIVSLIIRGKIKSQIHLKKQQASSEILEHKNKELTVNMLHLIEKEEVIKTLKEQLSKNNPDTSTVTLLKSLEQQSGNLWEAFNQRFMAQNKNFYERLQKKVPDLSSADLKVCALIKLNFSGKEMAYLLGISLGSVHVARHRLRKKMNLERDNNLTKFINSI